MIRLGVLLSGRGSNFVAIHRAMIENRLAGAEVCVVLSNHEAAPGLQAARDLGVRAIAVPSAGRKRADHDSELVARLQEHGAELVCLAGYMRLLSPTFVRAFPNRILNIHPSLLPAFPGLDAQRQALDYGAKVTGCTVHFVDEELDHGVIVLQRAVSIEDDDTEETLSARILQQEHVAYTDAIRRVMDGTYEIRGRRYVRKSLDGSSEID